MLKSTLFCSTTIWILGAAGTLGAQSAGSIDGKAVDLSGDPVGNALIKATNEQTNAVYAATTSPAGTFRFEKIPAGDYDLSSFPVAFMPFFMNHVAVRDGEALHVDLHFQDTQLNTLGDGREYFTDISNPHKTPAGPAPRTPEGQPDFAGVWHPRRVVDAGKPDVKPWVAALLKERAQNNGKDFPQTNCWPLGQIANTLQMWKIVQTPKLLVIIIEGELPRQVFLDGRKHPENWNPSWTGHSVGHWDGDTLVVDTVGFNDRSWLDPRGLPHSDKLHLIERYRRVDLGHLEIEATVDDPEAFNGPWVSKSVADLAADDDILEYVCTENERDRTHIVGK